MRTPSRCPWPVGSGPRRFFVIGVLPAMKTVITTKRPAGKVEAPAAGLTINTKVGAPHVDGYRDEYHTRRAALLGLAAAIPSTVAIAPALAGDHPDAELIRLGVEFERLFVEVQLLDEAVNEANDNYWASPPRCPAASPKSMSFLAPLWRTKPGTCAGARLSGDAA